MVLERAARATEGDWSQYNGVCRVTVVVEVVREAAVADTAVEIVTLVRVEHITFGMLVGTLPAYIMITEVVVNVGFARHQ